MTRTETMTPNQAAPEPAGALLILLEADLDAHGRYGTRTLEVSRDAVRVRERDETFSFEHPMTDIASARNEPVVGGGQLEITTKDGRVLIALAYTATLAAKFSEAARGIEQLAQGNPLLVQLKQEKIRCPKCHRRLPEADGPCPACVSRWRTMGRIMAFLQPYGRQVAVLVATSIAAAALQLIPPWIQRLAIDHVLQEPRGGRGLNYLYWLLGVWVAVVAVGAVMQIGKGRIIAYLSAYVIADIRGAVYRKIEFLKMSFFEKRKVGAIQSRLTNDTQNIWGFLVDGVPFLVSNTLVLIGALALMFATNWFLTLCILAPLAMVVLLSSVFWAKLVGKWHKWSHKWARFQSQLTEALTGVKVMKAFAQEDQEQAKFIKANDGLRHSGAEADQYWYTVFGGMTFFMGLGMIVHFGVGGAMVWRGDLSLGKFVQIQMYLGLIYGPMQWFAAFNNWFSRAMAGAERIFEIMDTEPEVTNRPHDATAQDRRIAGEVEFAEVRFGYDKSNPVIRGMSFKVAAGEMIGFVGKSGSGKSTTINLICRFYEPDSGTVKIDGRDYRDMGLHAMRRQIGVVLQEPFLFNGTIAENIAYGKPGASFEEITEAAKAANAHQFILGKPDGYDYVVGERGSKLSGGEKQRVSIARAILHDPRILILDEATSSVDVETEKQIQEAIGRLVQGRTTFAIAHRLSTLRNAHRLIVIEKGQIVESGTHAELMEKDGVFAGLVKTQLATSQIIGVGTGG